jgi:predicted amidohydrolase YtcJ
MTAKKLLLVPVLICLIFTLINCRSKKNVENPADFVLINGIIATMDDSNPNAQAIAIKGGKIQFVGTTEQVNQLVGDSTKVIDLKGKFVMPGFNDSHAHFLGIGESKMILDLREAKNYDEVIEVVARAADKAKPGEWIVGRGWHQEKFNPKPNPNVNGFPVHNELSKASPRNPVILRHASGHAILVNAKAMEIAGVDRNTRDVEGGILVRDANGNPIGVFEENAVDLITKYYDDYLAKRKPEDIRTDYIKKIMFASEDCLKKGVTSCADAGQPFKIIDLLKQLADSNKIPVRLNVMAEDSLQTMKTKLKDYLLVGYGSNHLNVRSIKKYIDGALGSRGAWMLEPYTDQPESSGKNVTSVDELNDFCEAAIQNGFQVCIHAIGDRGNREVLDLYEKIFKKYPGLKNLRWRIEHAQHLSSIDIPRFGKLGVIAAMQGIHCTSDATFVIERIGAKRAEEGAYAWKKLINSGTVVCNGTDAPVEDVDPIKCFYASVTRKLADGSSFYPEEKMTRLEALKSYTANGAYAAFEENVKGALKPGLLADVVVLSNDLLNCPDEQIASTKVVYTIVGGKIMYKAE